MFKLKRKSRDSIALRVARCEVFLEEAEKAIDEIGKTITKAGEHLAELAKTRDAAAAYAARVRAKIDGLEAVLAEEE